MSLDRTALEEEIDNLVKTQFGHENSDAPYTPTYTSLWKKIDKDLINNFSFSALTNKLSEHFNISVPANEWTECSNSEGKDVKSIKEIVEKYGAGPFKAFHYYYSIRTWGGGYDRDTFVFLFDEYIVTLEYYCDNG
ncbi:hypothetical protein ABK040_006707 [Willaertia magna]